MWSHLCAVPIQVSSVQASLPLGRRPQPSEPLLRLLRQVRRRSLGHRHSSSVEGQQALAIFSGAVRPKAQMHSASSLRVKASRSGLCSLYKRQVRHSVLQTTTKSPMKHRCPQVSLYCRRGDEPVWHASSGAIASQYAGAAQGRYLSEAARRRNWPSASCGCCYATFHCAAIWSPSAEPPFTICDQVRLASYVL